MELLTGDLNDTTINHTYVSTACLHGKHELCRLTCKYCGNVCICLVCKHAAPADQAGK